MEPAHHVEWYEYDDFQHNIANTNPNAENRNFLKSKITQIVECVQISVAYMTCFRQFRISRKPLTFRSQQIKLRNDNKTEYEICFECLYPGYVNSVNAHTTHTFEYKVKI